MSADADHYMVLGVATGAEPAAIRAAYRSLMRECHPDLNTNDAAAARARLANEAYRVLRDPEARAAYDRRRRRHAGMPGNVPASTPEFAYQSVVRHEIELARPQARGGRASWLPFSVFVLVIIGSFSVLLASGILDTPPVDLPKASFTGQKTNGDRRLDELIASIVDDGGTEPSPPSEKKSISDSGMSTDRAGSGSELPPVLPSDVAGGAGRFAQVSLQAGMAGAQQYSIYCHKQVSLTRSWQRADRCTAFDLTAAYVDADVARSTRSPTNNYFALSMRGRSSAYAPFGLPEVATAPRISEIQRVILPMIFAKNHSGAENPPLAERYALKAE